ncbi:hypothetical protein J6S55_02730 [Candidatus Saccharibacteria bacterium]|nr:hypothetical protein [Candidatus Saccharibacteria bacterium]
MSRKDIKDTLNEIHDAGAIKSPIVGQFDFKHLQNGYFLSFIGITKDEIVEVSVSSFKLNYTPMENLILSHLRPL